MVLHYYPPASRGRECARSSLSDGNALVSQPSAPDGRCRRWLTIYPRATEGKPEFALPGGDEHDGEQGSDCHEAPENLHRPAQPFYSHSKSSWKRRRSACRPAAVMRKNGYRRP